MSDELNQHEVEHPETEQAAAAEAPVEPAPLPQNPENDPFAGEAVPQDTAAPVEPVADPPPDLAAHTLRIFDSLATGFAHLASTGLQNGILGRLAADVRESIAVLRKAADG